jgi:transposase
MRSIGLDVGHRMAEVAISEPGRGTRRAGTISATPESLRSFAATLGPQDQVVLEATTNTWAIVELLQRHAGRVVVSNPLRTRAIADAKIKTDTVDAATLVELLAADYLPTVWQPDPATRALRRRVAGRAALVAERTRLRNRISAVLIRNLVHSPWSDTFGRSGRQWLATVELPDDERELVDQSLRLLDGLGTEIRTAETAIARAVVEDVRVRRLLTIPGIGIQSAVALVALIGDVGRFPRPNKLVSYLGLDPIVRQSGGRPAWTGHISHAGQAHVRSLLVEAAQVAIRVPGPLHAFFARVAHRRGHGIAIVAVARKLTVVAWHLLTHDVDYRWAPPRLTATKHRSLELAAGAPSRRGHRSGPRRVALQLAQERQLERSILAQAEAAYVASVRARAKDAAAATGERLGSAKAPRPGKAARRSQIPEPPPFATGSTASVPTILRDPSA